MFSLTIMLTLAECLNHTPESTLYLFESPRMDFMDSIDILRSLRAIVERHQVHAQADYHETH